MNQIHRAPEQFDFAAAAARRDDAQAEDFCRAVVAVPAACEDQMQRETTTARAAGSRTRGSKVHSTRIEPLRRRLGERLVLPEHAAYEEARRVWNGTVDKRPAMIAFCTGPREVMEAVTFARGRELPVSVRSGGHNVAGNSVCEGGLVIDLSRMKGIDVDPERRIARARAGLNLGKFDAATRAFGLATTMGVNGDTGIAGLTLGGGIGRLGRKHGLTCDNLLSVELVSAEGRLLEASATEHPDLFWGVRGGGGNFGIVTGFEYRLHPVGPTVLGGSLLFGREQLRDALRFYRDFASRAPHELSADAALATGPGGEPVLSISVCYAGPVEEGARVLQPLREFGAPLDDGIGPVTYLDLQSRGDAVFPRGRRYYWKAQFLKDIGDAAVDALIERFAKAPSPSSSAVLQQVGGAIARVPGAESPYANRDAAWDCFPVAIWDHPAADEANMRWAREFWDAMRPFATGGVYANNLGDEGDERVRAAYGPSYARLQAVKDKYDPDNVFRLNQNVKPTAAAHRPGPEETE